MKNNSNETTLQIVNFNGGVKMREQLKEIRKSKNLTQLQVANKLNIERSYYTKIERGQRTPSLDVALKIKEVLNYSDDDIFKNN